MEHHYRGWGRALAVVACLCLEVTVLARSHVNQKYLGSKVLNVTVENEVDVQALTSILRRFRDKVDMWKEALYPGDSSQVWVLGAELHSLTTELDAAHLRHSTSITDVGSLMKEVNLVNEFVQKNPNVHDVTHAQRWRRSGLRRVDNEIVGRYASYDEIVAWFGQLDVFFEDIVEQETIGKTVHGRDITLLKISYPHAPKLGAVFLDAGIHAREWISQATSVFLIYKLLNTIHEGAEHLELLKWWDWYILPVANPDGYEYSRDTERMWRKNTSPNPNTTYTSNSNTTCFGVDLNRNWGFHWNEAGTSDDPCSSVFGGHEADSEAEIKAMQQFLLRHKDYIKVYMSLHSYSQKLFTRWAYTDDKPSDYDDMLEIARKASLAIERVNKVDYVHGTAPDKLYKYSGGSADWVRGVAGIPYSFTFELQDEGHFGFLLPANYVMPVGAEIWAGVKVIATHVLDAEKGNATSYTVATEAPKNIFINNAINIHNPLAFTGLLLCCLQFHIILRLMKSLR